MVGLGIFCFLFQLGFSLKHGFPQPKVQDEFAYLLAGDTFSHGRLTNPVHPMWRHFETPHVVVNPTYSSKYPPGQGLTLALGQRLGNPIIGVWLAGALAVMAAVYFFYQALPPRWALLGGILCMVNPTFMSWSQSYWGGALQVLGGALVLGAALRIYEAQAHDRASWLHGVILGLGGAVLALSRPFEGACFFLLVTGTLAVALLRKGTFWAAAKRALPCAAVPLVAVLAWTAYFNKAVTGDWLVMPYMVHMKQYCASPAFVFQKQPPSPSLNLPHLAELAKWELEFYQKQQTLGGFVEFIFKAKLPMLFGRYITLWFFLGLMGAGLVLGYRRRDLRLALFLLGAFLLAALSVVWMAPHYIAAAFALQMFLVIVGLQEVSAKLPRLVAAAIALALVGFICAEVNQQFDKARLRQRPKTFGKARQMLIDELSALPGKHLVLVGSVIPHASYFSGWSYNRADIDGSKVVFANSLDDNTALLDYFKERKVWSLKFDADGRHLEEMKQSPDGTLSSH